MSVPPVKSRRRRKALPIEMKLWETPEMYAWLRGFAAARDWSVPQVVRHAIKCFPYKPGQGAP